MANLIKRLKQEIKRLKKIKLNKTTKIGVVIVVVLVVAGGLFMFKHLFVAAMVGNRPITRFALDRELEKQGGQQVLESLVSESLIFQEAERQNLRISQEEIEEQIAQLEVQIQAQGTDLETFLTTQGRTRGDLEKQIRLQLIIDKMLGERIVVSEEKVATYFEENQDFFTEGATLEDVKEDIEAQLRQEKMATEFQTWLQEVKERVNVRYFLEF